MDSKTKVEKELKRANSMFNSFKKYSDKLKKKYNNKVSFYPRLEDNGIKLLITCDMGLFHNNLQNPLKK